MRNGQRNVIYYNSMRGTVDLPTSKLMVNDCRKLLMTRLNTCTKIAVFLLLAMQTSPAFARYAAIVLDADSGRVLHARNADTRNYPASLTKMMTLYLVFDALESGRLKLDQRLPVSRRAAGMAPSKLGVKRGETITVETAILALVTKSANDAAVVVAEALGGTEAQFARIMTKKARQIGMRRTSFRNASGLPNRRQLSTARDMAILARRLLQDFPGQYRYFSRESYVFRGKQYKNHNTLLQSYPGTDGIKTGYIRASGFNLAASVRRDGRRLIGVVFGGRTARTRDRHMRNLLDRSFVALRTEASKHIAATPPRPAQVKPAPPAPTPVKSAARPAPDRKPALPRPAPRKPPVVSALYQKPQEWAIQVGAYGNIEPARRALRKAIARIPNLSKDARISISPYKAGETLMYRARLIGLSDSAAKTACRRLEKRKIPCVAIPSENFGRSGGPQNQTAAQSR